MNKQQLAAKIWASANRMRSKIEASEYKDYILGFIFYKYLSDQEVKFLKNNGYDEDGIRTYAVEENAEVVTFVQKNLGYFISYENLFSTWLAMGKDFSVDNVQVALSAFNRLISQTHKKVFEKIFLTLETGLSKLGDKTDTRTKAVSDLIRLIKDIPMDGKQDYDVLGFIYEYLISKFAANAGKKAGEFYTPHEVSELMAEIISHHLKDRDHIEIYDPTSGSGSLLITIGKAAERHIGYANRVKYYAQEYKENTYNLTRMNLVMRGILPDNLVTRNGDTLASDWPWFEDNDPAGTYDPLYVDAVVSNPPYSQNWDPTGKESDPRYARFGLAPKSKADYAFLLHDLYHIKPDGIMAIVLPHGVLFRGGEEGEIRKHLIEENHIDAIIGLPANIFYGTGIPTIIMVLRQKRDNTDVLIIDASKGFEKVGKNNRLRACDIKRIADTVSLRREEEGYARRVSREEIRRNDYNLNIPRYVDSSEAAETYDIYASFYGGIPEKEIDRLARYWTALPGLREALFHGDNGAYTALQGDVKTIMDTHPAVDRFTASAKDAFHDFPEALRKELVDAMETVSVVREEDRISDDIFRRLKGIPLIDPYEAYQLLHESWNTISADLEMIQTEGTSALRKVDPHYTAKSGKGKEQEVQDGWQGHIIPFALVEEKRLRKERDALQQKEDRLADIAGRTEDILESLPEEDKEGLTNDKGDAFASAALTRRAKEIRKEIKHPGEESPEGLILEADALQKEEKALKKEIKAGEAALEQAAKNAIENLTTEEARDFLVLKWIDPLQHAIEALPSRILRELEEEVEALSEKYAVTLPAIDEDIARTEKELAAMMDDLTGSPFDRKGLDAFRALLTGEHHG